MKAYSILMWFVFFNLVCGAIGTYVGSTETGGKDVFGIADKAGVRLLPEENEELITQFTATTEALRSSTNIWEYGINTINAIVLLPQLLLMMLTFIPTMLESLEILPVEITNILNLGIFFVTMIAIIQWLTNKWIGWAK